MATSGLTQIRLSEIRFYTNPVSLSGWLHRAAATAIMPSPATPLPSRGAFQIATSSPEPPVGDGWLFEVKDGHRLAVITDGDGGVRLLSRNSYDRSRHFGPVFGKLARLGRRVVLNGKIAAPDGRAPTPLQDIRYQPR
jgi:ATP-dependent DNA ligase